MAGGSMRQLQATMGHSDIRTTMGYAHTDLRASMAVIRDRGRVVNLKERKVKGE